MLDKLWRILTGRKYEYEKIFDSENPYWQGDLENNLIFLKMQQHYCNELLKTNGFLLLNEVYELLGFKRDLNGVKLGWVYNENYPVGDNFVDFGITINPIDTNEIILDFNIDGEILYLIPYIDKKLGSA